MLTETPDLMGALITSHKNPYNKHAYSKVFFCSRIILSHKTLYLDANLKIEF